MRPASAYIVSAMQGCVRYATTGASPSRSSRQDAASCIRGVWSNVLVVRKKNALWSMSTAGTGRGIETSGRQGRDAAGRRCRPYGHEHRVGASRPHHRGSVGVRVGDRAAAAGGRRPGGHRGRIDRGHRRGQGRRATACWPSPATSARRPSWRARSRRPWARLRRPGHARGLRGRHPHQAARRRHRDRLGRHVGRQPQGRVSGDAGCGAAPGRRRPGARPDRGHQLGRGQARLRLDRRLHGLQVRARGAGRVGRRGASHPMA